MPMIVEAKFTPDGRPEFDAAEFKEMEAVSRGPDVLTPQEMVMAVDAHESGNAAFKRGEIEQALTQYNTALEVFSDRRGGPLQRPRKSKLLANRAECLLRLEKWEAAEASAQMALSLDTANAKARFRRARALYELGGEAKLQEALDELDRLRLGQVKPSQGSEVSSSSGEGGALGPAEKALEQRVLSAQSELREVRRRDAGGLRKAFAAGAAGLSTPDDEIRAVLPPGADTATSAPQPGGLWRRCLELEGADEPTVYAYLVDAYRTRVDDDRAQPATAHGLGAIGYTPISVLADFLIFCKLANPKPNPNPNPNPNPGTPPSASSRTF